MPSPAELQCKLATIQNDTMYIGGTVVDWIPPNATIEQLRAHIKKLQCRIHNQRVALRINWEIVEMRASYNVAAGREVRTRWLKYMAKNQRPKAEATLDDREWPQPPR